MSEKRIFAGRLGIQQRVFPSYRAPFFEMLARRCEGGMNLFAGEPRPEEAIRVVETLRDGTFVPAENIHLFRGRAYLLYQRNFLSWLESWTPDALIVEANPRYLSTPRAIRWMRRRGRMVLGWGLGAPGARGALRPFWTRFLRQFDGLIAYSRRGAEEYKSCGIPSERVFVAANAVLPRPRWGLPTRTLSPNRLHVIYVGRLQVRKRLDSLLRACAALPESLRPEVWIVGDGPARASLERLAAEVYPRTKFFGAVYGESLRPIWMHADIFVLPGTGGLALQEAMSYGLPVIAAQGDGTQEDLVRPETGWRIPPNDEDALIETLREALANPTRLRTMGAAAYRLVSEEINTEKMVEVFLRALNFWKESRG